ncbi:MAG: TIGR01244 family phosphatase [Xanthomonadaceae bacterium]|nr:TIGR01244 family phosphatase [Xanthomonadaceae bacterium]
MQLQPLSSELSVTTQIAVADLAALAARGFRSVINNRPDGEEAGQPGSVALAQAASQAGLEYRHIPVVPGQLQDAQVAAFSAALAEMPAPTLAFCRTGTRSTMLWALQAKGSADAILATAGKAGYDLSALRPRLGDAAHRR